MLTKLAATTATGGAAVTLDADAPGSARVSISAESEVRFSISDAAGRSVMTGSVYNNGVSETRAYNTDNTLASINYSGAAIGTYSYGCPRQQEQDE
ncbi:hypothetical protein [Roseimaritima sediminicola]|uniref:hypothetical protein n=1 Tax=Roseimaritima sediminicola TaxID=2662066 RepID=UPI00129852C6|nr:hypothetical protein [Roseimaritima sediminicola]